jgi:hypothetical protein
VLFSQSGRVSSRLQMRRVSIPLALLRRIRLVRDQQILLGYNDECDVQGRMVSCLVIQGTACSGLIGRILNWTALISTGTILNVHKTAKRSSRLAPSLCSNTTQATKTTHGMHVIAVDGGMAAVARTIHTTGLPWTQPTGYTTGQLVQRFRIVQQLSLLLSRPRTTFLGVRIAQRQLAQDQSQAQMIACLSDKASIYRLVYCYWRP